MKALDNLIAYKKQKLREVKNANDFPVNSIERRLYAGQRSMKIGEITGLLIAQQLLKDEINGG